MARCNQQCRLPNRVNWAAGEPAALAPAVMMATYFLLCPSCSADDGLNRMLAGFDDKTAYAQCTFAYCEGELSPGSLLCGNVTGCWLEAMCCAVVHSIQQVAHSANILFASAAAPCRPGARASGVCGAHRRAHSAGPRPA